MNPYARGLGRTLPTLEHRHEYLKESIARRLAHVTNPGQVIGLNGPPSI